MVQFNITITRKRALAVIIIATALMVIDSSFVKFIASSNREFPSRMYVNIFMILTTVFVGTVIVLLRFVNIKDSKSGLRHVLKVKYSYLIISLTQYSLICILVIIILQIVLLNSYSIQSLFAAIYISHIFALLFIVFLVIILVEWIRTNRNKILWLYTISFTLTAFAILTSLIYATYALSFQTSSVRPTSIHFSLLNLPRPELAIYFGLTLDVINILSFVSVWIASAVLLSTYSRRIGKIRYWTIISIPLIYFLFPFETYFLNLFQPLVVSSPVFFGIVNISVFSATKQIGALFFSLAFLTASALVSKHVIQKYLLISAIGMATLFGSIEIDSILYATYPPFGLVTISFMPIGSYLLFTGLFHSATVAARDIELRKEFYKSAMSQLTLLKTIGVTEMEKELIKSVKFIESRVSSLVKDETPFVEELDREKIREILHDVLTELYSKSD